MPSFIRHADYEDFPTDASTLDFLPSYKLNDTNSEVAPNDKFSLSARFFQV